MLRNRRENAGAIAGAFAISRPAISRHLRVLREAGLVDQESLGRERTYRLQLGPLTELEAFLAELRAASEWERRLSALETEVHRVKRERRDARSAPQAATEKEKNTA